jgi:hypothetical protein
MSHLETKAKAKAKTKGLYYKTLRAFVEASETD